MTEFLFSEFTLWCWLFWAVVALPMGYLVVSSLDSPGETAAVVGAVAAFGGLFSLGSGGGFFRGAAESLHSLLMGMLLIPGFPALYLLPIGFSLGEALGFDWLGASACSVLVALIGAGLMTWAWVVALGLVRQAVGDFFAAFLCLPTFGVAPLIALMGAWA